MSDMDFELAEVIARSKAKAKNLSLAPNLTIEDIEVSAVLWSDLMDIHRNVDEAIKSLKEIHEAGLSTI